MKLFLTSLTLAAAVLAIFPTLAFAHPDFVPGSCKVLDRHRTGQIFTAQTAQEMDFRQPLLLLGDLDITCVVDLGAGTSQIFNFANTGDTCDLEREPTSIHTKDWTEIIKATGETILTCRFGPGPR